MKQTYHIIPQIIPLTSDTPRLRHTVLRSTAPRKRTFHQGCANPNGTATSRTSCRHTVCPHTRRRAFRTRLPPKVTRQVSKTSASFDTSSKSHASRLQDERFVRDFLQKSHVKSPKLAFRTRLPQKVTRQVSKTSVSYETSSKTHTSKSAKRAFCTRLPPKVKRKHPSEHTHHAALPSSLAIPAPPNNTNVTSTTTHNLTILCACHESFRVHTSNARKVLCLPRYVTSVTPRNLTIPCACRENRTSKPAQSTAPATKSDNIIACELQQNLHHTTRLE